MAESENPTLPLQEKLGHTFANPALLVEALTHSTFANENPGSGPDNERMEFVGDAVLDLLVARMLYETLTDAREGELSKRRAVMVCGAALSELAKAFELPEHLRLGVGQRASLSWRTLADAFEAVVGAVYLDGGLEAAERCFGPVLSELMQESDSVVEHKTRLQEACHQLQLPAPVYEVTRISGPQHARVYHCRVTIDGRALGVGEATSKKAAQQVCAELALAALTEAES